MKDFIYEFIEYMMAKYKRTSFSIDDIKYELITRFNKRSLMYASVAGRWLKQFFDLIQRMGLGTYDVAEMTLKLNENHEKIEIWKIKYIEGE